MSTTRVVKANEHWGSVSALSWVDPECGLPDVDRARVPARHLHRSRVLGRKLYRLGNFLEGWVYVDPRTGKITRAGFGGCSGMYKSPAFMNQTTERVGQMVREVKWNDGFATFVQLVGCRTVKTERLGSLVGGLQGGALACPLSDKLGRDRSSRMPHFPPIWSELQMTINNEGEVISELGRHSWFPSVTTFVEDPEQGDPVYLRVANFDGSKTMALWKETGWGVSPPKDPGPTEGNPWAVAVPSEIGGTHTAKPSPPVRPWPMREFSKASTMTEAYGDRRPVRRTSLRY